MTADIEALKRRLEGKIALAKTHSDMHVLLSLPDAERVLAALERIPELERERDAAIATVDAVTQRAEQVEAAARRMERWRDQAWRLGALGTQDIEALMSALATASDEEGKG